MEAVNTPTLPWMQMCNLLFLILRVWDQDWTRVQDFESRWEEAYGAPLADFGIVDVSGFLRHPNLPVTLVCRQGPDGLEVQWRRDPAGRRHRPAW